MNPNLKTRNQQPLNKDALKGCGLVAILAVIIFFVIKSCVFDSSANNEAQKQDSFKPSKSLALIVSRDFVKQRLKSPSSAEFDESTNGVVQLNDSTFMVSSHVDSQNSFGAMLRSEYKAVIVFDSKGMAKCEEVVLF